MLNILLILCHVSIFHHFFSDSFPWITRRFNRLRCWITTWCLGDLQIHGEGQVNALCCVQGSVMMEHPWRFFPHHKHGLQLMKIPCWWLEMCFLSWITSDWEFHKLVKRMDDWITFFQVCVGWGWRLSSYSNPKPELGRLPCSFSFSRHERKRQSKSLIVRSRVVCQECTPRKTKMDTQYFWFGKGGSF